MIEMNRRIPMKNSFTIVPPPGHAGALFGKTLMNHKEIKKTVSNRKSNRFVDVRAIALPSSHDNDIALDHF
jgi:hypothetical protein